MFDEAQKHTVIIVDDDDATRASLRFLLECEGIEVDDFASVTDLLAAGWPPEAGCMVLDIHMPGMTGLDVLDRLHTMQSPLPVIVVTGQPDAANRRRAFASGAMDVLEKPLNDDRIVELVQSALKRAQG